MKKGKIALLPIGSFEQHGPHLPLTLDTKIAVEIVKRVANKTNYILPSLNYSFSLEHTDFPGTITLSSKTFASVVREICISALKHGFKKIVIINAHGGNNKILRALLRKMKNKRVVIVNIWSLLTKKFEHAGNIETSIALFLDVKVRKLKGNKMSGVVGEPKKAKKSKGKILINKIVKYIRKFCE